MIEEEIPKQEVEFEFGQFNLTFSNANDFLANLNDEMVER